ncbi:MAG: DUF2163 domain-containing protein [Alphaproteobacteria bacterium]|nr:DUF2163 domain-containing protein [Alphaproteobacteria bacterium]
MKISPALHHHLQQPLTTTAYLWHISLSNGALLAYTSHDRAITYQSILFRPGAGLMTPSTLGYPDEQELPFTCEAIIDDDYLSIDIINNGLLDHAKVELWLVNYDDLSQGHRVLRVGEIVKIHLQGQRFYAEVAGLGDRLQARLGQFYSSTCRAELGDKKCGVMLAQYPSQIRCDKRFSTCVSYFNNAINFRGEPFIPGQSGLLSVEKGA